MRAYAAAPLMSGRQGGRDHAKPFDANDLRGRNRFLRFQVGPIDVIPTWRRRDENDEFPAQPVAFSGQTTSQTELLVNIFLSNNISIAVYSVLLSSNIFLVTFVINFFSFLKAFYYNCLWYIFFFFRVSMLSKSYLYSFLVVEIEYYL